MEFRKPLAIALLLTLILTTVTAYEFSAGTTEDGTTPPDAPSNPACLDGNDNDGDGLVDGADADSDNDGTPNWQEAGADGPDPGCSKPYKYDDSEDNLYDLDASWIFGNYLSGPTQDDSTVFYGSEAIQNGTTVTIHPDQILGTYEINETYIEDSNQNWAGGELKGSTITLTENRDEGVMPGSTTDTVEGSGELIDAPHNDTTSGDGTQCGDALRGSDENNFDCPEDYGLPDDAGTTKSQSVETLSSRFNDKVSQWDANNANDVSIGDYNNGAQNGEYLGTKNNNDDTDDNIEYRFSNSGQGLVAPEAQGQKTDDISGSDPYTGDLQSGTQANAGEVDDQVVQDQQWTDVPDYYLKDDDSDGVPDELWMVYPEKVGESYIGSSESDASVTDYDLTGDKNVETWGEDGGDVDQCSGANCSGTGSYECTSIDHDTDTKYTLKSETTTTVSTNDNEQYYADSSGSHQHSKESTNLNQLSVEVTHHPDYETEQVDDDSCLSETEEESCDSSIGCSDSTPVDTVGPISNQDIATGQTSNTITYRYEDLELKTEKVFDLNPAENPSYSPAFPTDALFEGDTFKGSESYDRSNIKYNAFNGDAYYGYTVDTDNNMLGNDEAISSSSFHMRVDGAQFESVRDYFRTWDVDGPEGQSDGFMAVLQRRGYLGNGEVETQGISNQFMNTETNNTERMDIVQPSDALGHISINTNGCGDPFTHCVAALDVRPRNLNNWDNPTDPSEQSSVQAYPTAVTFESNIQDTNQSLGVCKMYQEIDPDAAIGSNYESDSDSPTQASDQRCAGDTTEEFWVAMEGPEVNESAIESHHVEGTADRVTDCMWYGEDLQEGTVRTVGTNAYPNYELGGYSPDKEVCLAIDSSGESFTQDGRVYEETLPASDPGDDVDYDNYDYDDDGVVEEVGGEWYDLDNPRINEYLRNNGATLISNGDPDNSSQIAYYWRQNENRFDSDYNPKGQGSGENVGVALEDDCGPLVDGCDDSQDKTQGKQPVFFSFFWRLVGFQ